MTRLLTIAATLALMSCGSDDPRSGILAAWQAEQRSGGVMVVGDSITARWPDDLLPCGAYNRGIDGDTTVGVLGRLWLIEQEQPDVIFLMIGINDMASGQDARVEPIIHLIIDELAVSCPNTQVILLSIINSERIDYARIDAVNAQLATLPGYHSVNLAPVYRPDGTHPSRAGYVLLAEQYEAILGP